MGTNFFLRIDYCPHCNRCKEEIHLGKNSCGWKFLFRKSKNIRDYKSFCEFCKKGQIFDEYGREISYDDMLEIVNKPEGKCKHHSDCEIIDGYDFIGCDFC